MFPPPHLADTCGARGLDPADLIIAIGGNQEGRPTPPQPITNPARERRGCGKRGEGEKDPGNRGSGTAAKPGSCQGGG